jgi:hypothetical protein
METTEKYKAVITIADIRPPKNGRGSHTIYTIDGNEFGIWRDKIGLVCIGEQYEIEVADKEAGDGRVYHNIVGTPHRVKQPQPQPSTPTGKTMDQQYWTPKPRNPAEQKQIWVCAMLCRDMEACDGLMKIEQLIKRGEIHAQVWEHLFGVNGMSQKDAEKVLGFHQQRGDYDDER